MSGVDVFDMPEDVPDDVRRAVEAQLGTQPVAYPSRDTVDGFFRSMAQLIERTGKGEP